MIPGGSGRGAAVLTDPSGLDLDPRFEDLRYSSGHRLTPVFGVGVRRRPSPSELPPIGSPEHDALLSGEIDLEAIERAAADRRPLVGFSPIVLDPAGPGVDDYEADPPPAPVLPSSTRRPRSGRPEAGLPSRRALRAGARPAMPNQVGSPEGPLARTARRGRTRVAPQVPPPVITGPPTAGLRMHQVEEALETRFAPLLWRDSAPTGELARPFVDERALSPAFDAEALLDQVPPPVSVDVFQRAVRAGLDPDEAAAMLAADPDRELPNRIPASFRSVGVRRPRTRREARARERALTTPKGVAARRLAKGGVLAITALGVVSSASPQTLGVDQDGFTSAKAAMGLAQALTPSLEVPPLSPEGRSAQLQRTRATLMTTELADEVADGVTNAGLGAGGAAADWAKRHDAEAKARHEAALAAAAREAARDPKGYARQLMSEHGWDNAQFKCLDLLWTRESNWNYKAVNASSGAYGIAQALPGTKMSPYGSDWRTNPITQMKWGLDYIEDRYGTPCGAWNHSEQTGWY